MQHENKSLSIFFSLENDKNVLQVNSILSLSKITCKNHIFFYSMQVLINIDAYVPQNYHYDMIIVYACQYVHDIVSTVLSFPFVLNSKSLINISCSVLHNLYVYVYKTEIRLPYIYILLFTFIYWCLIQHLSWCTKGILRINLELGKYCMHGGSHARIQRHHLISSSYIEN